MKLLICVLISLSSIFAAPADLRSPFTRDKLSVYYSAVERLDGYYSSPRMIFVHMVPKNDFLSHFSEGVGCSDYNGNLKVHKFLNVDEGDKLVELMLLYSVQRWYVTLMGVWTPHSDSLVYRHYGGFKGKETKYFSSLEELVDFVDENFDVDHLKVFDKLLKRGLTAHVLTLKLHEKLLPRLNRVV